MYYLYKISKEMHLWSGLLLSLFILWMSVSGILLNHPGLISQFSLPLQIMPDSYTFKKWNRYAFRDACFSVSVQDRVYVCGKQGVWQSWDNGYSFSPMNEGFPGSAWQKDTFCLLESKTQNFLYAGTRSGLYAYDLSARKFARKKWIEIKELENNKIVSLVQNKNILYAFTPSECFVQDLTKSTVFQKVTLPAPKPLITEQSMSGFLLSFHDGSIVGLPGKIGADVMAGVMIFLTLSGISIWIISRNLKRFRGRKRVYKIFRFCYKYHLKLGIWCAVFIIVITLSGTVIKPPFRQWLYQNLGSQVSFLPGKQGNPWEDQIFKAVFLPDRKSILLSTRQGFYLSSHSLKKPFKKIDLPVKVSGMGATVLKKLSKNRLIVGSFSGLFEVDVERKTAQNIFNIPGSQKKAISTMACGALVKKNILIGHVDYRNGFSAVNTPCKSQFIMPEALVRNATIPLWYGLFELHNTRIFAFITQSQTWLIIPFCGILTLILILSGCFDWYYKKIRLKKH